MFGEGSLNATFFANMMGTNATWDTTKWTKARGYARYIIRISDDSAALLQDDSAVQLYAI